MAFSIEYKLAGPEDLPALVKVGDQLFDNPIKPERAKEFLSDPWHHLVLAYRDDQIVGMASGFHYIHPDKDPAMFINEVGVIDEYQNQGIGRELVNKLCLNAKNIGCTEAWVGTEVSNLAARKAYLAAGGKEDKEPFILIEFLFYRKH